MSDRRNFHGPRCCLRLVRRSSSSFYVIRASVLDLARETATRFTEGLQAFSELPEPAQEHRRYPSPALGRRMKSPSTWHQQWGKHRPDRLRRCRALCGNRRDLSALSHPGQRQGDKRAAGLHVLQRSDVEVAELSQPNFDNIKAGSGRIRSLQKLCEPTCCSRSTRS